MWEGGGDRRVGGCVCVGQQSPLPRLREEGIWQLG